MLAVKNLFDLGLIRHWALSNENAYGLTMFCLACDRLGVPRPVCVQNDMSLNNRVYEGDIAEAAHQFGVVGLPYGALSGGVPGSSALGSSALSSDALRGGLIGDGSRGNSARGGGAREYENCYIVKFCQIMSNSPNPKNQ